MVPSRPFVTQEYKQPKKNKDNQYVVTARPLNYEQKAWDLGPNAIRIQKFLGQNTNTNIRDTLMIRKFDRSIFGSCECGYLEGLIFEGQTCPKCHVKVERLGSFKNDIIIDIPFDMKVPHPRFYTILKSTAATKPYIDYILDPLAKVADKHVEFMEQIPRGLVNFSQKYEEIIRLCISNTKTPTSEKNINLLKFIEQYRDILFTSKLLAASSMHSSFSAHKKSKIVDRLFEPIHTAVTDFVMIRQRGNLHLSELESAIFNAFKQYMVYIKAVVECKIQRKKALTRGSLYGCNFHFSFRGVINPILDNHEGDEIHISWLVATELFKIHILNKLHQPKYGGMNYRDALLFIESHRTTYSKTIDQIFKELIEECPYKGLPALINRNPTLCPGSIVLVFIIKVVFGENVIRISDLIIPRLNADFDGDNINGLPLIENNQDFVNTFRHLHPSFQKLGYGNISCNIYIPKNLMLMCNEWYKDK